MTLMIDYVSSTDPRYAGVCANAAALYQEHLGLEPLHFPTHFVTLFDTQGNPIGGAGINDAMNAHRPAAGWAPPAAFRHLRLVHPARNRLPRDFIR